MIIRIRFMNIYIEKYNQDIIVPNIELKIVKKTSNILFKKDYQKLKPVLSTKYNFGYFNEIDFSHINNFRGLNIESYSPFQNTNEINPIQKNKLFNSFEY